jgi:hypothetical protein
MDVSMYGPDMSFVCPFCGSMREIRDGEFPYVRSQLLLMFELCRGVDAVTSADEIAAAADTLADDLLAARQFLTAVALLASPVCAGRSPMVAALPATPRFVQ